MKNATILISTILCLSSFLAQAQLNKVSAPRIGGSDQPVTKKIWSDWIKNSGNPSLEASYAKLTENEITLRLRNTGTGTMEGEFTANECPDNQKAINGWQRKVIEPGATITLKFPTEGCNAGFRWWSQNLVVWSDWFQLNPADYISARWVKRGSTITVELINRKNHTVNADFAANFCGENLKSMNGWHRVILYSNKITTLNITDGSSGRCNAGFHLWYRNLRGPQQIDHGTDLIPVGN